MNTTTTSTIGVKIDMSSAQIEEQCRQGDVMFRIAAYWGDSGERVVVRSSDGNWHIAEIHDSHDQWREGGQASYSYVEMI